MHTSTYICDRCKCESKTEAGHCAPPPNGWITVMVSNKMVAELCESCASLFKLFLKGSIQKIELGL